MDSSEISSQYSLGCKLIRVGLIIHFWLFNEMHFVWLDPLTMLTSNPKNIFLINLNILYHVFSSNIYRYR